jgi:hypothetical protein
MTLHDGLPSALAGASRVRCDPGTLLDMEVLPCWADTHQARLRFRTSKDAPPPHFPAILELHQHQALYLTLKRIMPSIEARADLCQLGWGDVG